MKLHNLAVVTAIALLVSTGAFAQFNRVGSAPSVTVSYTQVNAPQTSSWQGADVAVFLPLTSTEVSGQKVKFTADVQSQGLKSGGTSNNGTTTVFGIGGTAYLDWFIIQEIGLEPFFRLGVQESSGTLTGDGTAHSTTYNIEPGLIARFGLLYGLVSYKGSQEFSGGTFVSQPRVGLGWDFSKNFYIEAQYQMNRTDVNFNKTLVGVGYKF